MKLISILQKLAMVLIALAITGENAFAGHWVVSCEVAPYDYKTKYYFNTHSMNFPYAWSDVNKASAENSNTISLGGHVEFPGSDFPSNGAGSTAISSVPWKNGKFYVRCTVKPTLIWVRDNTPGITEDPAKHVAVVVRASAFAESLSWIGTLSFIGNCHVLSPTPLPVGDDLSGTINKLVPKVQTILYTVSNPSDANIVIPMNSKTVSAYIETANLLQSGSFGTRGRIDITAFELNILSPDPNNLAIYECPQPAQPKGFNQHILRGTPTKLDVRVSASGSQGDGLSDLQGQFSWKWQRPNSYGFPLTNTYKPWEMVDGGYSSIYSGIGTFFPRCVSPADVILYGNASQVPEANKVEGLKFNGLPDNNDGFGTYEIEHNFKGGLLATSPVGLFYEATEVTVHPLTLLFPADQSAAESSGGGFPPNWVYFYDQAWRNRWGIHLKYVPGTTSQYTNGQSWVNISDDTHGDEGTSYLFGIRPGFVDLAEVGTEQTRGLDTYARVITHECVHKLCRDHIQAGWPDLDNAWTASGDEVPDDWEALVGLNPADFDSIDWIHNGGASYPSYKYYNMDDEVFARMHCRVVLPDITKDWSNDGINYFHLQGPTPCKRFGGRSLEWATGDMDVAYASVTWPTLPAETTP